MSKVITRERNMTKDVIDMLVKLLEEQGKKIDKLENKFDQLDTKVDELIALKNKLIACGVVLSALFGFLWDWFKNFFNRG